MTRHQIETTITKILKKSGMTREEILVMAAEDVIDEVAIDINAALEHILLRLEEIDEDPMGSGSEPKRWP